MMKLIKNVYKKKQNKPNFLKYKKRKIPKKIVTHKKQINKFRLKKKRIFLQKVQKMLTKIYNYKKIHILIFKL